jgi:hypothetical protein
MSVTEIHHERRKGGFDPRIESCRLPTVRTENGSFGPGLPGDAGTVATAGAGSGCGAYMQQGHGNDVTVAVVRQCGDCSHFYEQTSALRPSEQARNHRVITLFRCALVPGANWSRLASACPDFVGRAR